MKAFDGFKLILVIILIAGLTYSAYFVNYSVTGEVQEKFIDYSSKGSHYIVVLEDGQLLEVKRNMFDWNPEHNPDRVYANINEGKTYTFECWGWIFDYFYWYPNVIQATPIN